MNKDNLSNERRRNPRFIVELPLEIKAPDFNLETRTKNISSAGVYCPVSRFLPIRTELAVTMRLSMMVEGKKMTKVVHCPAMVVHIEPPEDKGDGRIYNAGIAFSSVAEKDRDFLLKYVRKKNLKEAKELKKMYLKLKDMAARLVEIEECHPTAGHFLKIVDSAITELDSAAHILDFEINELKDLE